jgi:hypothetical protein
MGMSRRPRRRLPWPHMRSVHILMREIKAVIRGATKTHLHLRDRLVSVALVTLVVDAIGTVFVYMFEHTAPQSKVTTVGDALFWTTGQLLTVSSQLSAPLTTGGRIVDVFLMAYGITVVATLAGSFGAFFHRRGLERDPLHLPPQLP